MSHKGITCTVHIHNLTSVSGDGGDVGGVRGSRAAEGVSAFVSVTPLDFCEQGAIAF